MYLILAKSQINKQIYEINGYEKKIIRKTHKLQSLSIKHLNYQFKGEKLMCKN